MFPHDISHRPTAESRDYGAAAVTSQPAHSGLSAPKPSAGAVIAELALLRRQRLPQDQDAADTHVPLTLFAKGKSGGDSAGPLRRAILHKAVENVMKENNGSGASREEVTDEAIKIREASGLNNPDANFSALTPDVKAAPSAPAIAADASSSPHDHRRTALLRLRQAPALMRPMLERVRSAAAESARRLVPSPLDVQTGH